MAGNKSTHNPFRGLFSRTDKKSRHEATMNLLLDSMYNETLESTPEGEFEAVVLSGIIGETKVNNTDPFAIHQRSQKYEVVFRPLNIPQGQIVPDVAGLEDPKIILENIALHRFNKFIAISDSPNGVIPQFGEIIMVKCGSGTFKRGDCGDFVYTSIKDGSTRRKLTEYTNLKNINGTLKAANAFKNSVSVSKLGGQTPDVDTEVVVPSKQIPGTVLPIANPGISRITSAFGLRNHPVSGEKNKPHTGVDYGTSTVINGERRDSKEAQGMNILSVLPGVVTSAGASTGKNDTSTYVAETGATVGNAGYGLKVTVKSETQYGDGSPVTVYVDYGHLYDIPSNIKRGTKVEKGEVVGSMGNRGGSSGIHLHVTAKVNGKKVDPVFLFNWHNLTPWKHSAQKERFYANHPELEPYKN